MNNIPPHLQEKIREMAEQARSQAVQRIDEMQQEMREEDESARIEAKLLQQRMMAAHATALYQRTPRAQKQAIETHKDVAEFVDRRSRARKGQPTDKATIDRLKNLKRDVDNLSANTAMQGYRNQLFGQVIRAHQGKGPGFGGNASALQREYEKGLKKRVKQINQAEGSGLAPKSAKGGKGA